MAHPQHVASQFGPLADDFFISIAFLRGSDPDNLSLPFLHAHVLELSAKAVCHKLGVDIENVSHDVLKIYALLRPHLPDIATLIPTPVHLDAYKKTWVREDAAHRGVELPLRTNERLTLEPQQRVEVRLGSIEERDELAARELAYFVTNVKDQQRATAPPSAVEPAVTTTSSKKR